MMGSFTTAFFAFSDSSFELQAVKKVTNKMANTKYLNVFCFVRYGGYSPQLSNSSFVHSSGKIFVFGILVTCIFSNHFRLLLRDFLVHFQCIFWQH